MTDARTEGFRACMRGDSISDNPYANFTKEFSDWNDGWRDMDDHLNARDEALESIGWGKG